MYNYLSNELVNTADTVPDTVLPWLEALAEAQKRYDSAEQKDKRRWVAIMGTIRQAIERGEPWPT
jgi:hypothetical protein